MRIRRRGLSHHTIGILGQNILGGINGSTQTDFDLPLLAGVAASPRLGMASTKASSFSTDICLYELNRLDWGIHCSCIPVGCSDVSAKLRSKQVFIRVDSTLMPSYPKPVSEPPNRRYFQRGAFVYRKQGPIRPIECINNCRTLDVWRHFIKLSF